jgi:two-component system cell cycle sensor histidine kinase/response regulator CckA
VPFAVAGFANSDPMSQHAPSEQGSSLGLEQLSTLLDSARELHAILSADGTILFASAGFTVALGYHPEELVGRSLTAFLHPGEVANALAHLAELVASPGAALVERCRLRGKDGSWRWFECTARNRLRDTAFEGIVASFLDVTGLRRMEAERQVISDVIHALNQTANLDQLLQHVHRALKKVLYAENCYVALHDAAEDSFYFPFFVDQFDTTPAPKKVDRGCTAYVLRTGCAKLITQTEFDRLAAKGEVELVGSPSPAWLGVPLKTPTATIGVLGVQHYQNENAYDPRDLEFLDSVGGHIAIAIERRRAEDALRRSESIFRLLFSQNPLPTWVIDQETLGFIQVNEATANLYGYTAVEFKKLNTFDILVPEEADRLREHFRHSPMQGRHVGLWKHRKRDGSVFEVEISSHELLYGDRRVRLVVAQDVSQRHQLEEQLRQAQKMEAVGRLAGGVAHDFNNLLMVIKGHTELLLNALPSSDNAGRKIQQIDRAADRATSLTRQLLAFSRMQVLQPRAMSLNTVVEEMGKLLPRLIGEDIELVINTARDLGIVRADASQMEQVIMNLAVNARDAMPGGGRLLIEVSNAELDHSYAASHPVVQTGRYVLLAVTDTGTGMDPETQARIFEPFFTTKEQGKGTGLGLSTVYGVIKQSGGFIWVYSEPGKGTSFKIYLPRVDQPVEDTAAERVSATAPRGSETVLLAEDEQDVREVAREFLESGGYTVIEANNGAEALRLAAEHKGKIDLLVTDLVMPGMAGQELARLLQKESSGLGVIYMSGYSENAAAEAAQWDASTRLLTKPFSRNTILRTVRDVLSTAPTRT